MSIKRLSWSWLLILGVVGVATWDLMTEDSKLPKQPIPGLAWHLVDRLEFADRVQSPLLPPSANTLSKPKALSKSPVLTFEGEDSVNLARLDGVLLQRVLDESLEQGGCLEVRSDPGGSGAVTFEIPIDTVPTGGRVEIVGKIRMHAYESPKDVALILRTVRSFPSAYLSVESSPKPPSTDEIRLEGLPTMTAPRGKALLPGKGASDFLDFAAWQPFSYPVNVQEGTQSLQVFVRCDMAAFACRLDDIEVRSLDSLALFDRVGRYRFAKDTEVTAPLKKMIRVGSEDRFGIVSVPGTLFEDLVNLEEHSRLDLGLMLWTPPGLEITETRTLQVRVTSLETSESIERTYDVGASEEWRDETVYLATLGKGPVKVCLESPESEGDSWRDPPYLVVGDPHITARRKDDHTPAGIVLMTLDALSTNHIHGLGYHRETTPILDGLIRAGTSYSHAIAPSPSTYTSLPSLMSISHRRDGWVDFAATLDPQAPTLPSALVDAGFVVKPLIADYYFNPFFKGFTTRPYPYAKSWDSSNEIDDRLVDHFESWLGNVQDRRFFCWMHTNQPHGPNRPSPQHDLFANEPRVLEARSIVESYMNSKGVPGTKSVNEAAEQISMKRHLYQEDLVAEAEIVLTQLYDGSIHQADALVGRVIEVLKQRGLFEKTVLVISADHGWPLAPVMNPDILLPEGTFVIPAILHGPGIPAGKIMNRRISTIDFGKTFLAIVGAEQKGFEGRDLRETFSLPEEGFGEDFVPTQTSDYVIGYRGPWKLAVSRDEFQSKSLPEKGVSLFDLGVDPEGRIDVIAENRSVAESLYAALNDWYNQEGAFKTLELSSLVKGHLRRAGYLPDQK